MSIRTGQFIKLYKIISDNLFTDSRGPFGTQSNIYVGTFFAKKVKS